MAKVDTSSKRGSEKGRKYDASPAVAIADSLPSKESSLSINTNEKFHIDENKAATVIQGQMKRRFSKKITSSESDKRGEVIVRSPVDTNGGKSPTNSKSPKTVVSSDSSDKMTKSLSSSKVSKPSIATSNAIKTNDVKSPSPYASAKKAASTSPQHSSKAVPAAGLSAAVGSKMDDEKVVVVAAAAKEDIAAQRIQKQMIRRFSKGKIPPSKDEKKANAPDDMLRSMNTTPLKKGNLEDKKSEPIRESAEKIGFGRRKVFGEELSADIDKWQVL
jgi:hypothetical protein